VRTHVFAIDPLLAVDLKIPGKSSLEEGLVLGVVLDVELGVRVRLPIRGDVDDGDGVLATENQGTGDDGVSGGTEDTNGAEEVLAGRLKTVEETSDLVGGHEGLSELLVVLEVDPPCRVTLSIVAMSSSVFSFLLWSKMQHSLLVEPLKGTTGTAGLLVRVSAFPVLEVQCRFGEVVEGVLGFGLLRNEVILLLIVSSLGLGLLLSLGGSRSSGGGRLLLLGRGDKLDGLLGVLCLAEDGGELGLVDDGLEVADEMGELGTERGIDGGGDSALDDGGDEDIGKGDALADEEGAGREVGVKGIQCASLALDEASVELRQWVSDKSIIGSQQIDIRACCKETRPCRDQKRSWCSCRPQFRQDESIGQRERLLLWSFRGGQSWGQGKRLHKEVHQYHDK
jgi:hypothetical protein